LRRSRGGIREAVSAQAQCGVTRRRWRRSIQCADGAGISTDVVERRRRRRVVVCVCSAGITAGVVVRGVVVRGVIVRRVIICGVVAIGICAAGCAIACGCVSASSGAIVGSCVAAICSVAICIAAIIGCVVATVSAIIRGAIVLVLRRRLQLRKQVHAQLRRLDGFADDVAIGGYATEVVIAAAADVHALAGFGGGHRRATVIGSRDQSIVGGIGGRLVSGRGSRLQGAADTDAGVLRSYLVFVAVAFADAAGYRAETAAYHRHDGGVRRRRVRVELVGIEREFSVGLERNLGVVDHPDLRETVCAKQDRILLENLRATCQRANVAGSIARADVTTGHEYRADGIAGLGVRRQTETGKKRNEGKSMSAPERFAHLVANYCLYLLSGFPETAAL
jgi:hypothetical protein